MSRKRWRSSPRSSRVAKKRKVRVHRGLGELHARPLRGAQSDSRSGELKRRVTTATPVRSPMEQGKEPSQRSLELTVHEWVRQDGMPHSRLFTGDFAWRLPDGPLRRTETRMRPKNETLSTPASGARTVSRSGHHVRRISSDGCARHVHISRQRNGYQAFVVARFAPAEVSHAEHCS